MVDYTWRTCPWQHVFTGAHIAKLGAYDILDLEYND